MLKINQLTKNWQKGTIKTSTELSILGYNRDLLKRYTSSKWIESVGYGAYKLAEDNVKWYGALNALQEQKQSKLHAGGKTALELKGFAHYLSQGKKTVRLFGNPKEKLPKWFKNSNWDEQIGLVQTKLFDYKLDSLYSKITLEGIEVKIAVPELAAMEMLYLIPKEQSFEEAYLIMENLTTLRPKLVQQLLETCNSVKVKRIFMWMSEKLNHSWVEDIDISKVYFGVGKRVIVKEGRLDKKYSITVPGDE
ncbi:MAG: type IV toxin-antitoxin system AbiEi family antitoxin [Melioribacteraceae bacterium]|nr:type IV toxin-antitoxin system AbiEi family antitoxin [Melioribacteraceae bacterium]